jgi:signal transduction histidine kinase
VLVLLTLGLALILLALAPGRRRAPLLLAALGLLAALAARSVTAETFHLVAAGALPVLVCLLVREMVTTAGLVAPPRRTRGSPRRTAAQPAARRAEERERERRRRERRRLAA